MTGTPQLACLLQAGPHLELEFRPGTSCSACFSTSLWLDSALSKKSYAEIVPCYHLLSAYVGACGGLTSAAKDAVVCWVPSNELGRKLEEKCEKNSWWIEIKWRNKPKQCQLMQKQPPPTSTLMPSQFPSNSYFEKTPCPGFTAEHDILWHEIYLCSIWVSCPGCVPSQPLAHH